MYKVYINGVLVKKYPYEIQALIYCYMNGYVYTGGGWYFLDDRVRIKSDEEEDAI